MQGSNFILFLDKSVLGSFRQARVAKHRTMRVRIDLAWKGFEESIVGISSVRNLVVSIYDILQVVQYRNPGLLKYRLVWIDPLEVEAGYDSAPPHHWGVVSKSAGQIPTVPVMDALGGVPRFCRLRVVDGVSWEASGELERVISDRHAKQKPSDPSDSSFKTFWHKRYDLLDSIIEEVRTTRRIRPQKELRARSFRERGGIGILINAQGNFVLCDGHHRFGIALALGLKSIPVSVVSVHPQVAQRREWNRVFSRVHL
jgi:hypothetical protein